MNQRVNHAINYYKIFDGCLLSRNHVMWTGDVSKIADIMHPSQNKSCQNESCQNIFCIWQKIDEIYFNYLMYIYLRCIERGTLWLVKNCLDFSDFESTYKVFK